METQLKELLQEYIKVYPAFRNRLLGAPNSQVRLQQEYLIALEDKAKELLRK